MMAAAQVSERVKTARVALVVIKFRIDGEDYFLMRRDHNWNDVNFIGGHAESRDSSKLEKTAQRELLEEVPALRKFDAFRLLPLTGEVEYGPVFSRSAGCAVQHTLRFFCLQFDEKPQLVLFEDLLKRTRNLLVSETEIRQHSYRMTSLMGILDDSLDGGHSNIPYSWRGDLGTDIEEAFGSRPQLALPLHRIQQ